MKNHPSYWVLMLVLLLSGSLQAKVFNYVGLYGQVGEWSLLPSQSDFGPSFGVNGGAGFVYELQAGGKYAPTRFLMQVGVGPRAGMTSFIQGSNMLVERKNQLDLQGDVFDYVYEIQNRHDSYTNIGVQVPILIGVQHNKFYMLAGVKVNANLIKTATTTATLNTYGRYKEIPDLRNMEDYQFFSNYPLSGKASANLSNLSLDACLEIGGRFGGVFTNAVGFDVPKRKIEYRLAGFVEYGIGDIHSARSLEGFVAPQTYNGDDTYPVYNSTSMIDNLQVNDVMSTANFAAKVTNLVVGLKFTVLFPLPEEAKCVLCRDAYHSSARTHSSRRGMQYEE